MCYLCLRDNPFDVTDHTSPSATKRIRAAEIKRLLKDAEDWALCDEGDERVERLKDEQSRISREL